MRVSGPSKKILIKKTELVKKGGWGNPCFFAKIKNSFFTPPLSKQIQSEPHQSQGWRTVQNLNVRCFSV